MLSQNVTRGVEPIVEILLLIVYKGWKIENRNYATISMIARSLILGLDLHTRSVFDGKWWEFDPKFLTTRIIDMVSGKVGWLYF